MSTASSRHRNPLEALSGYKGKGAGESGGDHCGNEYELQKRPEW
jgi:hypothetical protein